MAALLNIYPPILNTFMPAFIYTDTCRIYFSLSSYNTYDEIKNNAQITVVSQKNNKNVLDTSKYSSAIKVTQVSIDSTVTTDDKYYVEVSPNDLKGGSFEPNEFYKIQIRFTQQTDSEGKEIPQASNPPASWFTENLNYFSEWSKVCLIKGIYQPSVTINLNTDTVNILNNPTLTIVGKMTYEADTTIQDETLDYYILYLYNSSGEVLKTVTQYSDNNEINYTFDYFLEKNNTYTIKLKYYTVNGYTNPTLLEYQAQVIYDAAAADFELTVSQNIDNGLIKVKITKTSGNFSYPIIIRRSDSDSDFKIWNTIKTFSNPTSVQEVFFNDKSIDGSVWYKYYASYCVNDTYGTPSEVTDPIICSYEDIYLTTKDVQLDIKYNPNISSVKYNISESKTDTLGGKFPIITRNGDMYYRTVSISGMIYSIMDEDGLFATDSDLYGEEADLYKDYNTKYSIRNNNDYIKERKFRDKVITFLHNAKPKLYRSTSEGIIIVKLMNISLTPDAQSGRLMYTFSADAVEIADSTLDNIEKYNLQYFDDSNVEVEYATSLEKTTGSVMIYTEGGSN